MSRIPRRVIDVLRATAALVDYSVALSIACLDHLRPRSRPVREPEPTLVAQAITLYGGRAIVHPVQAPRRQLPVGRVATLAIAAAALAATLGASEKLAAGYNRSVAVISGETAMSPEIVPHAPEQVRILALTLARSSLTPQVLQITETARRSSAVDSLAPEPVESRISGVWSAGLTAVEPLPAPPTAPLAAQPDTSAAPVTEPEFVQSDTSVAIESEQETARPETARPDIGDEPAAPAAQPAPNYRDSLPPPLDAFVGVTYSESELRVLATQAGWDPAHVEDLVKIAWCESRFRPTALGQQGALGLMQMMPFWFRHAGADIARWSDPVVNLQVALFAFQTDLDYGFGPWHAWQCLPIGGVATSAGE